jgi:hypothetical protein
VTSVPERAVVYEMSPLNDDVVMDLPRFLADDGCVAVSRLARLVVAAPWATRLSYDVSHCSLWLAPRGRARAEAIISYLGDRRDGQGGADPPALFELTFVGKQQVLRRDLQATVADLATWAETLP